MSTFFQKIFKPTLKKSVHDSAEFNSPHAHIRLKSTALLNPDDPDHRTILIRLIIEDNDIEVIKAAISRFELPADLINLLKQATSPQAKQAKRLLATRLLEISNQNKLTLFDFITEEHLIAEILLFATDLSLWENTLSRITDEQALYLLATQGKTAAMRQIAAKKLNSETQLNNLVKQSKGKDKKTFQIAKNSLDAIHLKKKETQSRIKQRANLLKSLLEHSRTEPNKLYGARSEALAGQWQKLNKEATQDEIEAFNQAISQARDKFKKYASILTNELVEKETRAQKLSERQATLETLQNTLNQFQTTEFQPAHINALNTIIKAQENRWIEANQGSNVDKQEQRTYEQLMKSLRLIYKTVSRFYASYNELSESIKNQDAKKVLSLSNQIEWPDTLIKPELITQTVTFLNAHKLTIQKVALNNQKNKEDFEKLISQLDNALEEKQLKSSRALLKSIYRARDQLAFPLSSTLQKRLNLYENKLRDLQDWQGFSVTPKLEKLCENMETLSKTSLEPRAKADKIHELQSQWKTLGGGSQPRIWARFKKAADEAYKPCKAFFNEQRHLETSNLEKRQEICNQLSQFLENYDWNQPDWKAIEKINKQARQDWKLASPVNFKMNRTIQECFNSQIENLDQHLQKEYVHNAQLKQNIVDRAKALNEREEIEDAIRQAKQLQKEWQTIGITRYKEDRKLWNAFREKCDIIFTRREEAQQQSLKNEEKKLEQIDICLNNLSNILEENTSILSDDNLQDIKIEKEHFKHLIATLSNQKTKVFQTQFKEISHRLDKKIQERQLADKLQFWEQLKVMAYALRNLALGIADKNSQHVDNKFISNMLDTLSNSGSDSQAMTISNELYSKWKDLINNPETGARTASEEESIEEMKERVILLEITKGIASPEEDNALRMTLQIKRLQTGMNKKTDQTPPKQQYEEQLFSWYEALSKCRINDTILKTLQDRVDRIT